MKRIHELTAEEIKVIYKLCTEVTKELKVGTIEKITVI